MSDFWEFAVNLYHTRLIPTAKRMLDRRRFIYTLLTVATFLVSATALSFLICYTAEALGDHARLAADYEEYLTRFSSSGIRRIPLAEMRSALALAKTAEIAMALLWGILWLLLSVVSIGWIMSAVVDSESYIYGLYMIYGADRRRLSHQLSVEFLLASVPALILGLPAGFALYRMTGGGAGVPLRGMLAAMPCFLILILVCAAYLSARVLKRPCMRMLNTADTSDITVSPRRSRLSGLTRKRNALSSAGLAIWRMRRHFAALSLAVLLVTAPVFAVLSPRGIPSADGPAFTLQLKEEINRDSLDSLYLEHLESSDSVGSLDYTAAETAQKLGIHILADHPTVAGEVGLPMGDRYITSAFRIACGDGDTSHELGDDLIIPEDKKHIPLPENMTTLGYQLDAVPEGYAVYVYPEGTTPPLSLQEDDTVRLYLPSDQTGLAGEYVTVRIMSVQAIPHLRGAQNGPVIAPRITEDYLYLSPSDYQKFCGEPHAKEFVGEEAYAPELFPDENTDGCILVIPQGEAPFSEAPSHVTVITPAEAVKEPFRDRLGKESLPLDTYFINHTPKGMGVYMGDKSAYLQDFDAYEALHKWQELTLREYVGAVLPDMEAREYRVKEIVYTEGGAPYIILPFGEYVHFSALQNDLCAFHLKEVGHLTMAVEEEAYLLETDTLLGASFAGRPCYVGTSLLPAFTAAMKAEHLDLQLPETTFLHTKTLIGNSFTLNRRHYLLTDMYPYEKDPNNPLPRLQADYYPRVITGVSSFCHLGVTDADSILDVAAIGARGLFSESAIGSLKAHSQAIPGQYAFNDWTVSPVQELLPTNFLPSGHVILVTNDPAGCPIRTGDILSIALWEDTQVYLSDPRFMSMQLRGDDTLPYLLERISYGYTEMVVDEVRAGDSTVLLMNESDMETILSRTGLYDRIRIFPTANTGVAAYMDLYTLLANLSKTAKVRGVLEYDMQYMIRRNTVSISDPTVIRTWGILASCMIPLFLAAVQLAFFEKRTEELRILSAIGIPSGCRRRQFAMETGLTSLLIGLSAALACPVGYLLVLILQDLVGVTHPVADFSLTLCAELSILAAVSCIIVGIMTYRRVDKRHNHSSKEAKEYHEGSGM